VHRVPGYFFYKKRRKKKKKYKENSILPVLKED
jgi:hypothetical protein